MSTMPARDDGLIVRTRLLRRLEAPQTKVALLHAPAGYGKSVLARQYGAQFPAASVCDCRRVETPRDMAARVLDALGGEGSSREPTLSQTLAITGASALDEHGVDIILNAWRREDTRSLFIFENAEALAFSDVLRQLLIQLLTARPAQRVIVICTRSALWLRSNRFVPPHALVRLGAEDLAFTSDEIAQIFADRGVTSRTIERIARASRGWPIAVLLLARLAQERNISDLLARMDAVDWTDLHDYLSTELLEGLSTMQLDTVLLCAALPHARIDDIKATLCIDERAIGKLLRELPFVAYSASGVLEVHPLFASLLRQKQGARMHELLLTAADAWQSADWSRAAELYACLADYDTALNLMLKRPWPVQGQTASLLRAVSLIPPEALRADLSLLTAYFANRRYLVDPERGLEEAKAAWEALNRPRGAELSLYASSLVGLAAECGDWDFAEEILRDIPDGGGAGVPQAYDAVVYIKALAEAYRGALGAAEAKVDRVEPVYREMPFFYGQWQTLRGAWIERPRGNRERERRFLAEAIACFSQVSQTNYLLAALIHAVIGAWLAGEDDTLERELSHLEASTSDGMAGFEAFSLAFRGQADETALNLVHYPAWRAYAAMATAARAPTDTHAARYARLAVAAAERSGQPFVEALAFVALAICVPPEHDQALRRAQQRAAEVDSAALQSAVAAVRSGGERGMLTAFVRRLQERAPHELPRVLLRFFSADVTVDGKFGEITDRQLELLFAIASRRRGLALREILEALWPHLEPEAAREAFKSCLYRLRRRIPDIVVHDRRDDRYRVGETVAVDLLSLELRLKGGSNATLTSEEWVELREAFQQIRGGDRLRAATWEWFLPVDHRINDLGREIAARLGMEALRLGRFEEALDLTRYMTGEDPVDETAREIAIRAYLGAGQHASALHEFRCYRDLLRAEFGAEPAESLRRLVAEAGGKDLVKA